MDLTRLQREVRQLPAGQRKKLTAWIVAEYPALSVDELLQKATRTSAAECRIPAPPTSENIPQGNALRQALKVAESLGLKK